MGQTRAADAADGSSGLTAAAGPLVTSAVETVSGVLEDAGSRGGAAWAALRREPAEMALARRWPWAVGAALAGAVAGVAAAYAVGRLHTQDAPGALDPEELEAVVDRPEDHPPSPD